MTQYIYQPDGSGPHNENSTFVKKLTGCGNPELLDLTQYGFVVYVPEVIAPTLAEKQASIWWQIKAERERCRTGGVLVAGKWFHTDDSSRIQHLGLTMMGAGIPANLQWKTMDGTFITMTQTLAGQIFTAVAAADQANFSNAEIHRLTMEALPDPLGYDFSSGWLDIYGG